jgi:hypothetical protein
MGIPRMKSTMAVDRGYSHPAFTVHDGSAAIHVTACPDIAPHTEEKEEMRRHA